MSDDQFTKLFKYIEKRFNTTDKNFSTQDKKIDAIYSILDSHLKNIETIMQENDVRDHQQERMERWIFQIADSLT